ncbi:PREDICTED: caveolin-2 [Ficedula albicollis]|nr:PREDICTED: caveolin-2 [Ficedula albicollis]
MPQTLTEAGGARGRGDSRARQRDGNRERRGSPGGLSPREGRSLLLFQLGFEDVIAEPELTHSFDKVWICSHALFELSKYVIYKVLTLVLAIPLALVLGIVFATLSCLHIWVVVPFVKTCLMVLPSVQTVWKSLTDVFVVPFFQSLGRCFAMVNIRLDQE